MLQEGRSGSPGFRPAQSPLVTPVWHHGTPANGNWPIDRVLTSMRVSLALAVFAGLARRRASADEQKLAAHGAQCTTRAAWLHAEAQRHLAVLSESGQRFVAWIGAMIDALDAHQRA